MTAVPFLMLIVFCMAGAAFFSGMETGIISINRMRLRHAVRQGADWAVRLQGFLLQPDRLLGTTLTGTNLCVVVGTVTGTSLAVKWLGPHGEYAATVLLSLVILIFCEYLPKAWFHGRPMRRSRMLLPALQAGELILRPVTCLVLHFSRVLLPGLTTPFSVRGPLVTREDLKSLAREGEKDGVLSPRERWMINRVFELSARTVAEVMVPRISMETVFDDTTVREFYELARRSDVTRMPVVSRETGAFTGIVNIFYVVSRQPSDLDRPVSAFARPPLFLRDNTPVDEIFPRLRRFRQPMGLVQDQEGVVVGLVTTEDILQEIVGKL
jgi:putative hemolysin